MALARRSKLRRVGVIGLLVGALWLAIGMFAIVAGMSGAPGSSPWSFFGEIFKVYLPMCIIGASVLGLCASFWIEKEI